MPLTDTILAEAVARYFRERDRYVKLASAVEGKVLAIVQNLGARATVQSRAKTVESFAGKLARFQKSGSKDALISSVDDVFHVVGDLAAVRVLPYIEEDRPRIVSRIVSIFVNEQGQAVGDAPGDIEAKPDPKGQPGKSSPHYRATHCRVFLPQADCRGAYENLGGTPCEIQVCSLLAHVWNEIEHDMGYKPAGGGLSAEERGCLEELARLTIDGDAVIKRLMAAADAKLAVSEGDFADEADFSARLRLGGTALPESPAVNTRELYHALLSCGLRTPKDIERELQGAGWQARGEALIVQLNAVAAGLGRDWRLDPQEHLLALLLDKHADKLIRDWPMQKARPRRSVEIAELLRDVKKGKYRKMLEG